MINTLRLKLKEQKGFTLIELLAVIVILGIIMAIAVPAISNVMNKSEVKAQAQEGVQIINAAKMYVANESDAVKDAGGGTYVSSTGLGTLDKAQLEVYLDRYDATTDFEVIISAGAASSGKYTFTLKNHPAAGTAATAEISEANLIIKAK
ncbi:MAG: type II secretion system GspH family protein [Bacillus sp. (in: Bacteria)]|nr:type II secretion system GspH family protein [Bacillus sp. (in: firmicutes)]